MRGEYWSVKPSRPVSRELPPRARRILGVGGGDELQIGTTSACAENTGNGFPGAIHFWNYLRVRGEYVERLRGDGCRKELPPRARRIRVIFFQQSVNPGTTSACAENTVDPIGCPQPSGNYLRVRGEYCMAQEKLFPPVELPPRARRIQSATLTERKIHGTTSACAENTWG